jgi:hypothetical protein
MPAFQETGRLPRVLIRAEMRCFETACCCRILNMGLLQFRVFGFGDGMSGSASFQRARKSPQKPCLTEVGAHPPSNDYPLALEDRHSRCASLSNSPEAG